MGRPLSIEWNSAFGAWQLNRSGGRGGEQELEQEQEEEEEAAFIRGVNTNEDSPNAQHAPHRPVQEEEEEEEVVFTRDNRGGSAQHATRATPIR